jgi:hypothetical protein
VLPSRGACGQPFSSGYARSGWPGAPRLPSPGPVACARGRRSRRIYGRWSRSGLL